MSNELNFLKKLLPSLTQSDSVAVGPGDDCAALNWDENHLLLVAVDQLIGGVHFFRETTTPKQAGRKLICRNLSDIAAMGGSPLWALLTVATAGRNADWILNFCHGVSECAAQYGVSIVGGDTASLPAPGEVTTLTIMGIIERDNIVRRNGAKPNDVLFVTGTLGNSLKSGHHLNFTPRLAEGRFLSQNYYATAMIDLSDGLLLDARRLAEASDVRFALDVNALPLRAGANQNNALADGEDYELLFTVPHDRADHLEREWKFGKLTRIGIAQSGTPDICEMNGKSLTANRKCGYEH
ncbi:MAG: thiamine-phosphate kinase [Victivallales bacterium]|jgi:thiamine-monophosphate kinase|nr:thiamine-phosphate kinase [Victivallales bacterium]